MVEVFPNAPITEALIDIRAQLAASVTMADLESLHARIKTEYPDKKTRKRFEGRFEIKDDKGSVKTSGVQEDGYLFTSADGKQIAQFRLDGFTFNRLRPYSRWEDMYQEARRTWEIYRNGVKPVLVTHIGVRYLNSIGIPSKTFDYDDYFTATPRIPQALPQILQHFFTRVMIPFADHGATAIVIQTPSGRPDPVNTDIILDVEVICEHSFEPRDERMWEAFGNLRKIKNDVFFSHITERTKELFR
jgi:uncharacterized protein (TIGR04255 family)